MRILRTLTPWIILLTLGVVLCSGCQGNSSREEEQELFQTESLAQQEVPKKVIFILVDSLMSSAIKKGIEQRELPAFQFLIEHGQFYDQVVSSFPTMSVTIDSSIFTGSYPDEHHVPGLIWYSAAEKRVINYGTGWMEVVKDGINPVLKDVLIHLNQTHLNRKKSTIYEDLAQQGVTSGTINGLIYRGKAKHTLSIPNWLNGVTSLPSEIEVKGPDFFSYGSLANPLEGVIQLPQGITQNIGFNNQYALEMMRYLIQTKQLPDFLYVYLPDLDKQFHKHGPSGLEGVKEIDQQLQYVLESFGSPEAALDEVTLMIVGDSGQTKILDSKQQPVIQLEALLHQYDILPPGAQVTKETEVVLAVNERMAYVYTLSPSLSDLASLFKNESRIDVIAWKEKGWIQVIQGDTGKTLRYKPKGKWSDPFQQSWTIEGSPEVLDIQLNQTTRSIQYGEYPDAFQRLAGALDSHKGNFLVITAKPGYELAAKSSPTHKNGGGHGSLHQTDSLVPLIITGTNEKPEHQRLIDMKAFILKLLTVKRR